MPTKLPSDPLRPTPPSLPAVLQSFLPGGADGAGAHGLPGAAGPSYEELQTRHRRLLAETRRLKRVARKDPLTGVLNRRALDEALRLRWARYQHGAPAFGIILCDIDHFKAINDRHGHAAGDAVLVASARALSTALRGDDQFGRYGGEEFLAIVDTDSVSRLHDVCERLRLRLGRATTDGIHVTASLGAAVASGVDSPGNLLAAADRALYAAKARGRNRTIVWTGGETVDDALALVGEPHRAADGTEREAAAAGPAERLGGAVGRSVDGLLVADAEGRIVQWNDALARLCDLSAATLATATLATVDGCFMPIVTGEGGARPGGPLGTPVRFVMSPDERIIERRAQPFGLAAGSSGWLITFRQVDRLPVEVQARASEGDGESDRLRHALRMESVGRLAGGIAHDFNNLLTAMIGYAEMLQDEVGPRDSLREVLHAARSAADLTRQLLAFSRQQRLEPRIVSVSSVVGGLGAMVRRLIGDDVRLTIDAPEGLPNVCADPTQLEQIVINLVINARDAMPRGGDLTVSVRSHRLCGPRPGREVQPSGDYVQIVVNDTGVGIPPELVSKVFEPFFTTKAHQGTGLGLSTVYGIVKQSGGFIWIDSEVGAGTTFTIELPATRAEVVAAPAAGTDATPGRAPGGRILVVEDQDSVRMLTRELLESAGYDVITSATPQEALDLATAAGSPVDAVLTDVTMPGMTGSELAVAIRARRPSLPVLFMSGLPSALDSDGPDPILPKPFTRAALVEHVRRIGSC